jgi:hypothetical protein
MDTPEHDGHEPGDHPETADATKLIRIGTMLQAIVAELRDLDVEAAGRHRLERLHEESVNLLKDAVPEPLAAELDRLVPHVAQDHATVEELRLAQAQLAGWLEGLFRGMQIEALQARSPAPPGSLPGQPGQPGQPAPSPLGQRGYL